MLGLFWTVLGKAWTELKSPWIPLDMGGWDKDGGACPPVLSLQLGVRQPLVRDLPGSVWGPPHGLPGSQMTGLGSGETHSCLGSCVGWWSHGTLHENGGKLRLGQLLCLWTNRQEQQPLLPEEKKRSERGPNQGN